MGAGQDPGSEGAGPGRLSACDPLFVLLVLVPAVEIASIMLMTTWVGGALTFALIIVGAVVGALVMRYAGRSVVEPACVRWCARRRRGVDRTRLPTPSRRPTVACCSWAACSSRSPASSVTSWDSCCSCPSSAPASAWRPPHGYCALSPPSPAGFVVGQTAPRRGPGAGAGPTVTVEQVVPGEVLRGRGPSPRTPHGASTGGPGQPGQPRRRTSRGGKAPRQGRRGRGRSSGPLGQADLRVWGWGARRRRGLLSLAVW